MKGVGERLPAAPFVAWLKAQEKIAPRTELAQRLGTTDRTLYRYVNGLDSRNQPTDEYALADIDRMLTHAGLKLWDVYPDEFPEGGTATIITAYCPGCEEDVVPNDDGTCPWCDSQTGGVEVVVAVDVEREIRLGTTCPSCGKRKSRGAGACRACWKDSMEERRDKRTGRMKRVHPPQAYVCPDCGARRKSPTATRCWPCYQAAGGHRGRKHRKGHNLAKITPELLEEARLLYASGQSIREVARAIYPRTGYASLTSCSNALYDAFRNRGWKLRERTLAVRTSNKKRAFRPRCKHIFKLGARKGTRCEARSIGEDGYCHKHKPERIEAAIQRLRGRG